MRRGVIAAVLAALLAAGPVQAARVEITGTTGNWRLTVDGQPFRINGASAFIHLDTFVASGGNTLRTYGAEHARMLDEAQGKGLKVIYGLDLAKPRKGFDYRDPAAVAAQEAAILAEVARLKGHPALLAWALGNELDLATADAAPAFRAVGRLARAIKAIDPDHPTMIVVAEVTADKIAAINAAAPDVDLLGINAYGGAGSAPARAIAAGWTRPIVLTEFGPLGHWETGMSPWGAPYEPTSAAKAAFYRQSWNQAVTERPGSVLGGVAFLWDAKQETTATWYGMFLGSGERLASVDAMRTIWTGQPVPDPAPVIERLDIGGPRFAPGAQFEATAVMGQPAPTRWRWELREESRDRKTGGDPEAEPPLVPNAIGGGTGPRVTVTAPRQPGAYRLFVYGYDGKGAAATANLPLLVE